MDKEIQDNQFQIRQVYVEKAVFETRARVDFQKEKWQPHLDVEINNQSKKLDEEGHYQINLRITITAKQNNKIVFWLDIHQVGIFFIGDLPEDILNSVVNVECPSILFPFAREVIADLVTKGGFPQLLLSPLNFEALYRQKTLSPQEQKTPTVTH